MKMAIAIRLPRRDGFGYELEFLVTKDKPLAVPCWRSGSPQEPEGISSIAVLSSPYLRLIFLIAVLAWSSHKMLWFLWKRKYLRFGKQSALEVVVCNVVKSSLEHQNLKFPEIERISGWTIDTRKP
jgi:hypothetical protein